jgi:DNA-binding MarR family transcriptional regulator
MVATSQGPRIHEIAHDVFGFVRHVCLASPRLRRQRPKLREMDFLALTLLDERGTMIVGDIQRLLGVLPAQMSRIIRRLEADRQSPLIACRINPQDKRKIDVSLTDAGMKALAEYESMRVERIAEMLNELGEGEQESLQQLLGKVMSRRDSSSLHGEWPGTVPSGPGPDCVNPPAAE